jgi:gamma-glutamyltranspeptidase/glutathione hydrolase
MLIEACPADSGVFADFVRAGGTWELQPLNVAGEAARVNHGNNGLQVESAMPDAVIAALTERGHKVEHSVGACGGYQGIMFDARTGVLMGGSDVRKDGLAIGW